VLPFFAEYDMGLIRILIDRGTEYYGKPETYDYQLYLAVNDVEHSKTKARPTRGRTASASAFIQPSCKSFIKSRSKRGST